MFGSVWQEHKRFLITLWFLAVGFRLLFFFVFLVDNPCQLMYDAGHYHYPAVNLAAGDGFSLGGKPYFYRMPGYSGFLAACYALFGVHVQVALLIQILLAACVPGFVFLLARIMFSDKQHVAYVASGMAVVHSGFLIFSGLVMTETWFAILFMSFLCLFFKLFDQTSSWVFFVAGFMLSLATMFRPVGHYVLVLACLVLLVRNRFQFYALKQIIFLCAGWSVLVIPWVLRNYWLTGYLFLHTLAGHHFINHTAIRLAMDIHKLSWQEARERVYAELAAREQIEQQKLGRPLLEIEYSNLGERHARTYMTQYWWYTCKHALGNMIKTAFSLYSSELLMIDAGGVLPTYAADRSWVAMVKRFLWPEVHQKLIIPVIYFELLFFMFVLFGCLGFCVQALFDHVLLGKMLVGIAFIGLFVGLSSSCGFARLRLPVEPIMLIFASYFWVQIIKRQVHAS